MKAENNQELIQRVKTHALENMQFKKELIDSPIDAIENLTGTRLTTIEMTRIISGKDGLLNLNDTQLTDKELELVSGGDDGKKSFDDFVSYIKSWFPE